MLVSFDSEPSMSNLRDVLDDSGSPLLAGRAVRGGFFRMWQHSKFVLTCHVDARLAYICGLYPDTDHFEFWFLAGPALRNHAHIVRRQSRAEFSKHLRAYKPVVTLIGDNSQAGARLARIIGFKPTGQIGFMGRSRYEVYKWVD